GCDSVVSCIESRVRVNKETKNVIEEYDILTGNCLHTYATSGQLSDVLGVSTEVVRKAYTYNRHINNRFFRRHRTTGIVLPCVDGGWQLINGFSNYLLNKAGDVYSLTRRRTLTRS